MKKQMPPKEMQISSNFKNISLIPFNVDYVYLNFYCKESEALNDI